MLKMGRGSLLNSRPMVSGPIRFCPFCRDPFEGTDRCPTHDLPLVDLSQLPPDREDGEHRRQGKMPVFSLGAGRGWLFASAAGLMAGFVVPLVTIADTIRSPEPHTLSALAIALRVAPNLWVCVAVAVSYIAIVFRHRTAASLRRVRLAVAALTLFPVASLLLTGVRLWRGAEATQATITLEWGLLIPVVALCLGGVGAHRLGRGAIS